jgi:hypothetical protein
MAQDAPKIATVVKIAGIQWFNRMEEGVKKYAADTGADAFQVGPAQADPQQQAALIEDMIAQGVNALAVIPMSPEALEPVLGKGREFALSPILEPLAAFKDDMVVLSGIDSVGKGHVKLTGAFLTGTAIENAAPKPVPPKVAGPLSEPPATPALPATRPPSADWNPINSVPVAPLL